MDQSVQGGDQSVRGGSTVMDKYGNLAVQATKLVRTGAHPTPPDAWDAAALTVFPDGPAAQEKSCPRCAYLGLCEEGLVAGVPPGEYINGKENKGYALRAVKLLQKEPGLAHRDPKALWALVMAGERKKHNSQMDVVLALWGHGM